MTMESESLLPCVEVNPEGAARSSVIWLHGLGADGHDFEPLVPQFALPVELGIRFIFPHAPKRAVTINNGMVMPAWYDITAMDMSAVEDTKGIHQSAAQVMQLLAREYERGIPFDKIILAGFSQGGAIALQAGLRCQHRLAGILALSTYLPLRDSVAEERHPANADIPIFIGHGINDTVVPISVAGLCVEKLEALGYTPELHRYAMEHSVCMDELRDIGEWLRRWLEASNPIS